jgi:hypothetical protein
MAAISAVLLIASQLVPGMEPWSLIAAPCLAAAAFLILKGRLAGSRARPNPAGQPARDRPRARAARGQQPEKEPDYLVVDGSNVMHWNDGPPSLDPLRLVLDDLTGRGFTPGVIFDANAGYKLFARFEDAGSFAARLGLPDDRVFVVPKGTQADRYILEAARTLRARVVTNDRYRDWHDQFPEVEEPSFLICGGAREGRIWLGLSSRPPRRD